MIHNDVLRSIRFMLKINDSALAAIAGLGGSSITAKDVSAFLKRDDELGYQPCPEPVMAQFLDGLIIHQRGCPTFGKLERQFA